MKIIKSLGSVLLIILFLFLSPISSSFTFASDLYINSNGSNTTSSENTSGSFSDEEAATALMGVLGLSMAASSIFVVFIWGLVCIAFLIHFAGIIFTILMAVDCYKRSFPDRELWLVILIVGIFVGYGWVASVIYYLAVKKPAEEIK